VAEELEPDDEVVPLPSRNHAIVLVSKVHNPTLRALAYARATRPHDLTRSPWRSTRRRDPGAAEQWSGVSCPCR
jgi:hypothetical protein